ncbi:flagellar hook-length control protein FliK [Sinirhodobacter ferrireducens]|uniref:Flagellar hook-length control protein FliK n=2 Tax=Paenirhodobacter ferrireducens TaxID=1215032 RepID=A0A443L859_9RHOB|nr:flagellar hook-length control protein FliK [Sinirhodobacter ferrireducens]
MQITASMPDNPAPATKTEPSQTPAPAEAAPAPAPPAEAAPDSRTSEAPVRPITTAPAGADGVDGARSAAAGIAPDAAPQPQPAPEQAGTGRPAPETGAQAAAAAARPRSEAAPAAPQMVAPVFAGRANSQEWTAARPAAPARATAGPTATEPRSAPRAAVRPPPDEGGDAAGQARATAAGPAASGPDSAGPGPGLAAPALAPTPAGREIGHVPAHHVLRQLHEAVVHHPDGPVEVALSPEELGRVRLTLHPAEHGITVAVQAERPETLDLMRRNIEMLARDFRDLGYTDVSFSFGAESGRQQRGETTPDNSFGAEPDRPAPVTPAAAPPRPAPRGTDGSLDLRM